MDEFTDLNFEINLENSFVCQSKEQGFPGQSNFILNGDILILTNEEEISGSGYSSTTNELSIDEKSTRIEYNCPVCRKVFRKKSQLIRHQSVHSPSGRKFICIECGKGFRQPSTLTQHLAIHSTNRPYICEICSKEFNRISTLISHRKTHSIVKPFICPICQKGFHQKGNLRNHVYTHNNSRPYHCPFCTKGFNQMSNLQCHKQKMHANEFIFEWACSRCDQTFFKRTMLRAHEYEVHKVNGPITNGKKKPTKRTEIDPKTIALIFRRIDAVEQANRPSYAIIHYINGALLLVRCHNIDNQTIFCYLDESEYLTIVDKEYTIIASVYQSIDSEGNLYYNVQPPQSEYPFIQYTLNDGCNDPNGIRMDQKPQIPLFEKFDQPESKVTVLFSQQPVVFSAGDRYVEPDTDESKSLLDLSQCNLDHLRESPKCYEELIPKNEPIDIYDESFEAFVSAIKIEGFEPDVDEIKAFFSTNGLNLSDEIINVD